MESLAASPLKIPSSPRRRGSKEDTIPAFTGMTRKDKMIKRENGYEIERYEKIH